MTMLLIKGTAIKSTLKYIQSGFSATEYGRFCDGLPPDLKEFVTKPLYTSEWYPALAYARLMESYANKEGKDPREVYWAMGRKGSDDALTTVYRIFYKLGNPSFIIQRAPIVWKNYYSEGVFEVPKVSAISATARVMEAAMPHEGVCTRVSGWIQRTMEHAGGSDVRVEHTKCTLRDGPHEEWDIRWTL